MNILGQLQNAINQFNANPDNFSTVTATLPDGTTIAPVKTTKDAKLKKDE